MICRNVTKNVFNDGQMTNRPTADINETTVIDSEHPNPSSDNSDFHSTSNVMYLQTNVITSAILKVVPFSAMSTECLLHT